MEPLNISRENFPMSTASATGMIPMSPKQDNYEIFYKEDVPYQVRGERTLYLQIIGPIGVQEAVPCIVYIPGSAFHEQNVKERIPQLSYFAQMGFVVAALEYRGSEAAPFPAQSLDAKAGVRFMKEHAEEYGIPAMEEADNTSDKPLVKGVIDLYGPTNFLTMNDEPSSQDHRTPDSPEGCEIGGKPVLEHPELVAPSILANYVRKDRILPPILMFHGTNDELVPFGQSCELSDALTNAGKDVTFYQVFGAHHGGWEFWTKEVLDIERRFMERVCDNI